MKLNITQETAAKEIANNQTFSPELTTQHYNTSIYRGTLKFLKITLGEQKARDLVGRSGLSWDYLMSESNWVSETFAERFYDLLVEHPDVPEDFSLQSGKLSMEKSDWGAVQIIAVQFLDPKMIFQKIIYFSQQFNKADKIDVIAINKNSLTFKLTAGRKTKHFEKFIQSWTGFLGAVPELFGLPPAEIKTQTLGPYSAIIEAKWTSNQSVRITKYGLVLSLIANGTLLILFLKALVQFHWVSLSLIAPLILLLVLDRVRNQLQGTGAKQLQRMLKESNERYDELLDSKSNLARRYKEAKILSDVIQRISQGLDPYQIVDTTLKELKLSLGYDRVFFLKHDREKNQLNFGAATGFSLKMNQVIQKYFVDLNEETQVPHHLGNLFKSRSPLLIPITSDYLKTLSNQGQSTLTALGSKSFLVSPCFTEVSTYGLLLVDYFESDKTLTTEDLDFVQNVSQQLAISLQNALTLEKEKKLRSSFQRFVPIEVVESMMGENALNLENGFSAEMTVLFSDFRGFTKRSHEVHPSVLYRALNTYFRKISPYVFQNDGVIERFVGDGMLAIFNAFGKTPNHTECAVRTADLIRKSMAEINLAVAEELKSETSWQPLELSIAIHTGTLIMGKIEADRKVEFTSIGETVNVAARIAEISKKYPHSILVSNAVSQLIKNKFQLKSVGSHSIRGLDESIELFLLLNEDEK